MSQTAIEERAEVLFNGGVAEAEREFAPRANRASLESEIRSYIREQAKQPDGAANVRAAMLESKDVAAVIFHSPAFLVGINPETHSKLRFDASERWLPKPRPRESAHSTDGKKEPNVATVDIHPLPASSRKTKFRPGPPPIFPDGAPEPEDVELALALFNELDDESQRWYGIDLPERLQRRFGG